MDLLESSVIPYWQVERYIIELSFLPGFALHPVYPFRFIYIETQHEAMPAVIGAFEGMLAFQILVDAFNAQPRFIPLPNL